MEIEPQKLYSASILQWAYLFLGIMAVLWNYIGVFKAFLLFFTERSSELQRILGQNFIDTYFLVIGVLCLIIYWGISSYTKQGITLAFFANIGIIVITLAAVIVPVLALYLNSALIDKPTWTLILLFIYLPIFLPIAAFSATSFYLITRNLSYIMFFGKQEAGT